MVAAVVERYLVFWEETAIHPQRACYFCEHGEGADGSRTCLNPTARTGPVALLRAQGAECGPEAHLFQLMERRS